MSRALLSLAAHTYVLAAVVYLAHLVRQRRALALAGRVLIGIGLVLQGVGLGSALVEQGGVTAGLAQGLSAVSFLLLAIFFALDLRYRLPVMGAFITPLAVAILVPALLLGLGGAPIPTSVQRPLLPLHISIALLGMAAFAIAAGVALMYLLMERQMKAKHFGLLFSRLPSLKFLDELNRHLVVWGFVALSVTLVTGAVLFYGGSGGLYWRWESRQVATAVAWLLFALLLNARFFAGWQGKRAAVLTMAGFCVLVVSFLSSYDPHRDLGAFR
jgi:ABC-type uncharacterized transport system permease subunit